MTAKYEHDDIARIAYRSWLDRGQPDGSPEIDWYYALSVVTNPEEIRPTPFGSFAADDTSDEASEETNAQSGDGSLSASQRDSSSTGTADWPGLRDDGVRNESDAELGDNEVTQRSDQFSLDQKKIPASRSRKKGLSEGKERQSERSR